MNFVHPTNQKYVQNNHFTKFSYEQNENYINESNESNKNESKMNKNLIKNNQKATRNHVFKDISNALTTDKEQTNIKESQTKQIVHRISYSKNFEVNKCYFLNQEEKCISDQMKKKKRKISVKNKKKLFLQFDDQDQQQNSSDVDNQIPYQYQPLQIDEDKISKQNGTYKNMDKIIESKAKRFNLMHNELNFESSSDEAQQQIKSSSSQNSAQKIMFQFPKLRSNIFLKDEQFEDSEDSANCSEQNKAQILQVCEKDSIKENDEQNYQNKSKRSISTTVTDFRRQHVNQGQSYLNKPLPLNMTLDLIIKRDKSKKLSNYIEYFLYDSKTLKLLLIVRKSSSYQMYAKANIQNPKAHPDINYLAAKLQSNFLGNEFNLKVIDINKCQQLSETITYEMNILGLNGPRKMNIYIPNDHLIKYKCDKTLQTVYQKRWKDSITKYVNKQATWNIEINSYVLNLKGKARMSSVKNFVIVKDQPALKNQQNSSSDDLQNQKNYVIFGKVNRDIFNLTLAGPFTILQGLSIALSSFDRKITCQ